MSEANDWTIFGERLSCFLEDKNVSLRELSRRTGIALTTLHRYATSRRVPRATEILKCADALGVTCDYLVGLSDAPHQTGQTADVPGTNVGDITDKSAQNVRDGDLILRKQAIEAVTRGLKGVFVEYEDIAKKMIGKLPSAQPDIIRCCDCKWWERTPNSTMSIEYHACKRSLRAGVSMTAYDFCSRAERRNF